MPQKATLSVDKKQHTYSSHTHAHNAKGKKQFAQGPSRSSSTYIVNMLIPLSVPCTVTVIVFRNKNRMTSKLMRKGKKKTDSGWHARYDTTSMTTQTDE